MTTDTPAISTTPHPADLTADSGTGMNTNRWLVLAIVCLAQFMVILDATIVNIAMPSIQSDLQLSAANLQWIINSYTLMFGGFLLLGGRAADLLGRKRLFVAGVVLFTAASLVNGLSNTGSMLIIARGFQGLGGALVSPAALSIITSTFADGPDRTKALGVWGGIAAGGSAFGLLLGGVLTEQLSWEWTFFVNVPVGILTVLAALRLVPESRGTHEHRHFDLAGAVTVTGGLIALVYAIVKAQEWGWTSGSTIGTGALAISLLTAFVFVERASKAPLVRLDIFAMRSLSVSNMTMLLVGAGMFAMFFFSSLYIQQVLGFGPLKAGFAFLPVSAAIIFSAGMSTVLVPRFGVRPVTGLGLVLATIGMAMWVNVDIHSSYTSGVLPALLPIAFGMGFVFVPLTLLATTNVHEQDNGLASGIFNTSQQIGGALGLAILSTLATGTTNDSLAKLGHVPTRPDQLSAMVDGYHTAYVVGAVFMAAALVVFVSGIRKSDVAAIESGPITMPVG